MYRKLLYVLSLIIVLFLAGKVLATDVDVLIHNPDIGMPVIDGVMDDPWSYATEQEVTITIVGSDPSGPADCSGTWRALWDYDYIYGWVEVNDEALQADSGRSSSWQDDSVEFYIDGDNSKLDSVDENDHQYTFAWNNGEVEEPRAHHHGEPSIVGIEYAVVTTGNGYLFEFRIPWMSIMDKPPVPGQLIGIEVFINDDDDGGSEDSQIAWFGTEENGWQTPSMWATGLLVAGNKAGAPDPPDGAIHPDIWATLRWIAGPTAVSHDVYIGDDLDAVDNATHDSDEFRGNQTLNYLVVGFPGFPYPEGLVPGTTYHWRIDEIDAEGTFYKGVVWSFSIPPKTAYAPDPIDGAEFVDLDAALTWTPGFGAKLHTVYFGDDYDTVANAVTGIPLGLATYSPGPLELEKVYYWRVDEFDGIGMYKGDVWSFTTPGAVGNPSPAYDATDVGINAVLSWTPSVSAASHQLYFGTDKETVRAADTGSPEYKGSKTLGAESHDPGLLDADTTYYWRVDEVDAQGNTVKGPVWIFTTGTFLLVDDFEDYTDDDAADEAIWQHWIDGFGVPDNGAQVGNLVPPYCEQVIVHGGAQSMPLFYTNEGGVMDSEATLPLTALRDWTQSSVAELSLWFRGDSTNAAEPLYTSISNTAGSPMVVPYDDPSAATVRSWVQWRIPLQRFADQGINLANVDKLTIGLGSKGGAAVGGTGTMYIDDLRLYRSEP